MSKYNITMKQKNDSGIILEDILMDNYKGEIL